MSTYAVHGRDPSLKHETHLLIEKEFETSVEPCFAEPEPDPGARVVFPSLPLRACMLSFFPRRQFLPEAVISRGCADWM